MLDARAQVHRTELISELVARSRRRRGLTQDALANLLAEASGNQSVTREEVSRWERGKRIPGPYWRDWLCRSLELPQDRLEHAAVAARLCRRGGPPRPWAG
ncbi:helix-turn-helix transcriptional regulator [Amycolatopsis nigrescens]|uniref:helix-turn-helix transcriptional regulator n=1 Tax=Amycolatopsis nigrescens TaxID=381445 RepID=UPI00036BD372|nr:helix-turn-helix domain-containing protein [Amycolatopsis nigrescens]